MGTKAFAGCGGAVAPTNARTDQDRVPLVGVRLSIVGALDGEVCCPLMAANQQFLKLEFNGLAH